MVYALGVLTALFVVVVAVQAIRGRARVATCCTYVPPERDARLGLGTATALPADAVAPPAAADAVAPPAAADAARLTAADAARLTAAD